MANQDLLCAAELIVVNVGGDRNALNAILDDADLEHDCLRIVHVEGVAFNKSLALNLGIHVATHDACLMLDADMHLADYDLPAATAVLETNAFVTLKIVKASDCGREEAEGCLKEVRHLVSFSFEGGEVAVETSALSMGGSRRSGPGILLAKKEWLRRIGGYNSRLRGWGWEDVDVLLRLQRLGFRREALGVGIHLSRADDPDLKRAASEAGNRAVAFNLYDSGDFEGTFDRDVVTCFGRRVLAGGTGAAS